MRQLKNRRSGVFLSHYGFLGLFSLAFDVAMTRIRFPKCRLFRRPFYIRGRRWIDFGESLTCGRGLRMDALGDSSSVGPIIRIGASVELNDYVHIGAIESVTIGDRVLIASKVFITDHDHGDYGKGSLHSDPGVPPSQRLLVSSPVVIEDDVWLGEFVSVLPGVRVGRGSVIGAMSTVTRDIPPYSIAVGSPARVIKVFNFTTRLWERV